MKLMQIEADHQAFMDLIEQAGGEITPENEALIDAMFEEIKTNVAVKTDGYCNMIAHLKTRSALFKEREEIFAKTRKAIDNAEDRLRERLKEFGLENKYLSCSEEVPGQKKKKPGAKIETPGGWVVSVQNAGGKRAMTLDEKYKDVPDEFLIYEEPKIDKAKVREALEAGRELPFATLEPQGITLIIK